MTSLVIITPKADREAVRANLESAGYGPDNVSAPMVGNDLVEDSANATHYGTHWFATDDVISHVESIRDTVLSSSAVVINGASDTLDTEPAQTPLGLFNAAAGDSIVLRHKQFPNTKWGWRAEMVVASQSFEPGVRAIAVYSNSTHTAFLYTTGAFVWDATTSKWATEWNDQRDNKSDVHWAILFAAAQEKKGTLLASQDASSLYFRFGLSVQQPGYPAWVQPLGAFDAYPLGAEVSHNGQNWRSTVAANVWAPGVFGWVVI
jgi:hypothetical protein